MIIVIPISLNDDIRHLENRYVTFLTFDILLTFPVSLNETENAKVKS
jgi:hypothetical protein